MNSNSDVIIRITDQNDHAPKFVEDTMRIDITENISPGATVGQIAVYDDDKISEFGITLEYQMGSEYIAAITTVDNKENKEFWKEDKNPFELGATTTVNCKGCDGLDNCACADVRIKNNFRNMVNSVNLTLPTINHVTKV